VLEATASDLYPKFYAGIDEIYAEIQSSTVKAFIAIRFGTLRYITITVPESTVLLLYTLVLEI
jgi:hypothetical protein